MLYSTKLKFLREEFDMTQNITGKLIGIDSGTYSNYEHEVILIPIKHLVTLCDYFNVSLDYIFSFNNYKQYDNSKKDINKDLTIIRLKEFRKENKLTQEKLAKILNISSGTIAGYEIGRYIIATPFLYEICSKYHISADYLLGKIDSPKYLK